MYRAFPGSDYYEGSAPNPDHRQTPRFAPRGGPDRFPRSLSFGRQDRRPAFLLRSLSRRSRSTRRAPPAARSHRHRRPGTREIDGFPRTASPAHIHRVGAGWSLEEIRPLVRSRYVSLPRLPGTRRPIVPARPVVVRAAPILPRGSGIGLPSASTDCCDSPLAGSRTPPDPTAPRGARSRPPSAPARANATASPTKSSRRRSCTCARTSATVML